MGDVEDPCRSLMARYWKHLAEVERFTIQAVSGPRSEPSSLADRITAKLNASNSKPGPVKWPEVHEMVRVVFNMMVLGAGDDEGEPPEAFTYSPEGIVALRDLLVLGNVVLNVGRYERWLVQAMIKDEGLAEPNVTLDGRSSAYLASLADSTESLASAFQTATEGHLTAGRRQAPWLGIIEAFSEWPDDPSLDGSSSGARSATRYLGPHTSLTDSDPRQIGGFSIQGRIGSTRLSTVYLGRVGESVDGETQWAAVKVVPRSLLESREGGEALMHRLRSEARKLRAVRTHLVPDLISVGEVDEWFVIATEAKPYANLAQHIRDSRDGRMRLEHVRSLGRCLADALHALHDQHLVHRDIKPPNILWEGTTAYLVDLGIALGVDDTRITNPGNVIGTPGWIAPERFEVEPGEDDLVSPSSDVWGWGAVMFFAATGLQPFAGDQDVIRGSEPDWAHIEHLGTDLVDLIRSCLASDPSSRPINGSALRQRLERVLA